ncbi:MAG: TylF/MycF/NovP-related O-methyltransferase, partial [Bacteroidota bacterium]
MQPTVFQIINYILILLVLILFIRYMWGVFFDGNYQPVDWRYALSKGKVSDKVKKIEKKYPDKVRFFTWWFLVDRLRLEEIPGDFAELGVYKGESAKILHHLDPDRTLHLFDTFSGFSGHDLGNETGKAATYTPDNFSDTEVNKVLNFIGGNVNIRIYPGYFPETAGAVGERKFALVNLDADLYNPTMAGLNFFYP